MSTIPEQPLFSSQSPNPSNTLPVHENKAEFSLVDVAAILWRRRWLVVGLPVVAAILSVAFAAISIFLPPETSYLPTVYTPRATILIDAPSSGGISSLLSSSSLGGLATIAGVSTKGNSNGTLALVLSTSNTTLDALNEQYDLTNRYKIKDTIRTKTRKAILSSLTVKFDEKTNIFSIAYTDKDPVLAQNIVNSIVEIIGARFAALGGNRALSQKKLLETKLSEVETSIDRLETEVKTFQDKYGVLNVDALATEQITIVARLRSELILKDMEISNYEKVSRIDDPINKKLKDEREILFAKIRELEVGKASTSQVGKVIPSQKEFPEIAFEYSRLQRDLLVQTEVFKLLTQQYEMAKLNVIGLDSVFQILELAEVPDTKSGPARSQIVILSVMLASFFAILIAILLDAFEKMKSDTKTVMRFKMLSTRKVEKK